MMHVMFISMSLLLSMLFYVPIPVNYV